MSEFGTPGSGSGTEADEPRGDTSEEKQAWSAVLEDVQTIASQLEADGWTAVTTPAGDTAPEPADAGPSDRFGFVHVVPGDDAGRIRELLDGAEITEFNVYSRTVGETFFFVTELRAPEQKTAVLVAGAYDVGEVRPLYETARERGCVYTHLQKLDGTHVASVRHDDFEKLFPDSLRE